MTHSTLAPAQGHSSSRTLRRTSHSPVRQVSGRETAIRQAPVRQPPVRQPPVRQAPVRQTAMRLTRRGRILLVVLAAAVLVVVFSIGRATSHASTSDTTAVRATAVVQRGETLWQVARRVAPKADPRITVQRLIDLNGLDSAGEVQAGQEIVLPA